MTKIMYQPEQWKYLADTLSCLYTEDNNYSLTRQDPTQQDSENGSSPLTHSTECDPGEISKFEVLMVSYNHNHSDCDDDCSIHQVVLDPSDYKNKNTINKWEDYQSISSGKSNEEIQHLAEH